MTDGTNDLPAATDARDARLAELERAAQRQATPFARQRRAEHPKRPGRKAGQGPFRSRLRPRPEQVTETKEQPLDACPSCGGALTDRKDHEQFVIDIPEVRPTVTRYVTHSRQCAQCGQRVRSHHPEQISEATGAAGVVIGPRAKALAADLKHRLGVPYGKVAEVLDLGFGLPISRGGLCQADARLAEQARPVYVELLDLIRQSAVAHVDETGWRIGTLSAWLSVFTNRDHKPSLPPADFAVQAAELEARLDALIDSRRQLTDADNARFAKRLRKHRAHLLRFLYVEGLDATNHQAERMLRPAVITRKTGGCNRTEGGAESHSILTSVLVTCRQQGFSLLDSLIQIQRNLGSTLESLAPPLLDTS